MPHALVNEPLEFSAPLAYAWSRQLCPMHPDGGCSYYHGFWQYLRLMGLGSTLGGHPAEYLREFYDLAIQWSGSARRIMISGCADYSMLAHLVAAFSYSGCQAHFTALDQCRTPLALNDWYARRTGVPVELVCSNVLDHIPDVKFDLIVTSSFLGYFPDEVRPALFKKFHGFLNPGGKLIFSNRLRPQGAQRQVGFSTEDKHDLVKAVLARAALLPEETRIEQVDLASMAQQYAGKRTPYPLRSPQEIEDLARSAGFLVEACRRVVNPPTQAVVRGPTLSDGSEFVMVRLKR